MSGSGMSGSGSGSGNDDGVWRSRVPCYPRPPPARGAVPRISWGRARRSAVVTPRRRRATVLGMVSVSFSFVSVAASSVARWFGTPKPAPLPLPLTNPAAHVHVRVHVPLPQPAVAVMAAAATAVSPPSGILVLMIVFLVMVMLRWRGMGWLRLWLMQLLVTVPAFSPPTTSTSAIGIILLRRRPTVVVLEPVVPFSVQGRAVSRIWLPPNRPHPRVRRVVRTVTVAVHRIMERCRPLSAAPCCTMQVARLHIL